MEKLRLHLAVLGSFLFGATAGPLAWLALGHLAMLLPCAVIALLAAFDAATGLTAHSLSTPPADPASQVVPSG